MKVIQVLLTDLCIVSGCMTELHMQCEFNYPHRSHNIYTGQDGKENEPPTEQGAFLKDPFSLLC